jgi:hypothetical protein
MARPASSQSGAARYRAGCGTPQATRKQGAGCGAAAPPHIPPLLPARQDVPQGVRPTAQQFILDMNGSFMLLFLPTTA